MKKNISFLLCVLILFSLCGCDKQNDLNDINGNKIYSAELTEDEQNLLNLLGVQNDISIYEFEIDDTYESISIWLEAYENGELLSINSRTSSNIKSNEGKIAVIIDKTSNYEWRISVQNQNGISSYSFSTDNDFETSKEYSRGTSELTDPIEIIPDKEIVLNAFLYEDENSMSIYFNQNYVENPEVLKEYDYIYLLKCKFSDKSIKELENQN